MPSQIAPMGLAEPAQCHARLQPQTVLIINVQGGRHQQPPRVVKADQKAVEQRIQIGDQQEAVEHVQPLGVVGALRPGFGVAGAQNRRQGQAGYSAGAAPVVQHGCAEFLLPNPLAYQALCLGTTEPRRQLSQLVRHGDLKVLCRLAGQGTRQTRAAAQQRRQRGFIVGRKTARMQRLGKRALPLALANAQVKPRRLEESEQVAATDTHAAKGGDTLESRWLAALNQAGLAPPDALNLPVNQGEATAAAQYKAARALVFLTSVDAATTATLQDKGWQVLDFSEPEHWAARFAEHHAVFGPAC